MHSLWPNFSIPNGWLFFLNIIIRYYGNSEFLPPICRKWVLQKGVRKLLCHWRGRSGVSTKRNLKTDCGQKRTFNKRSLWACVKQNAWLRQKQNGFAVFTKTCEGLIFPICIIACHCSVDENYSDSSVMLPLSWTWRERSSSVGKTLRWIWLRAGCASVISHHVYRNSHCVPNVLEIKWLFPRQWFSISGEVWELKLKRNEKDGKMKSDRTFLFSQR